MSNLLAEDVEIEIELSNGHNVQAGFDIDDSFNVGNVSIASQKYRRLPDDGGHPKFEKIETGEWIEIKKFSDKFQSMVTDSLEAWVQNAWEEPEPADSREEPEWGEDR